MQCKSCQLDQITSSRELIWILLKMSLISLLLFIQDSLRFFPICDNLDIKHNTNTLSIFILNTLARHLHSWITFPFFSYFSFLIQWFITMNGVLKFAWGLEKSDQRKGFLVIQILKHGFLLSWHEHCAWHIEGTTHDEMRVKWRHMHQGFWGTIEVVVDY